MSGTAQPGRWYVNKWGEDYARYVVGVEWSSWGKPLIRVRQVWAGPQSSRGLIIAERTLKGNVWRSWAGTVQPLGWEPSWWSTAQMGPSVKS